MERNRQIYNVTLVGGVVNVVLLAFKFLAGILGHSAAMVADAVHSLSDFVTDIILSRLWPGRTGRNCSPPVF